MSEANDTLLGKMVRIKECGGCGGEHIGIVSDVLTDQEGIVSDPDNCRPKDYTLAEWFKLVESAKK